MNIESGRHFKIIRSIGVSLGLWPYRRTLLRIMNGALAVTVIILFIIAQLAVFTTHEFSVDLFFKGVASIIPFTVIVVKYFSFVWNMDQVKYVSEWIQSDYDSLANERELRLIEKFAERGTIINKCFCYCFLLLIFPFGFPVLSEFFNIATPFNQSRSVLIPFNVEFFVDQDRYFYWIMFHFNASMILGVSILYFTEFTSVQFTIHACGLLEITRFIENMNTSLLPHYCIIFSIGVVSLSMNLYVVAKAMLLMKVTAEVLTAVILVVVHFFYMGCGNYIAQIVLDKGNDLFMKTYYASWDEAPLPVQKMLLYMRQRSMLPTALVFGGLYTGSFDFFAKLVNISMSYFMVLYSTS